MNDLADSVEGHQVALSDASGTAIPELCAKNSGDHRIRVRSEVGLLEEDERRTINVTKIQLDRMVEDGTVDLTSPGDGLVPCSRSSRAIPDVMGCRPSSTSWLIAALQ